MEEDLPKKVVYPWAAVKDTRHPSRMAIVKDRYRQGWVSPRIGCRQGWGRMRAEVDTAAALARLAADDAAALAPDGAPEATSDPIPALSAALIAACAELEQTLGQAKEMKTGKLPCPASSRRIRHIKRSKPQGLEALAELG